LDRVAAFHVADQSLERLRDRMLAVTRRQPARALAHVYLGAALCRLGQPGAGQEACTRAARLAPASVPANLGLARAANQAGDHETSVRALRRILELEPGHEAAWMELADTYDAAGLSALALEHCQQMLAFSGGQGPVARRARKVLSKLGNRSVGSPMSRPDVETEMQQCLSEGRWAEARAYAESLLRLNPYHLRALLAQGEVALQANNLDHASRSIRTAAAQYPGCPTAHALLARLLELEGNAPAARSEAFRAHELEPAGAQTASLLARLLGQDGQDEAAETVLRETLAACGRPEEGLRLALALCLEKRGDLAGALQALSTPPVDSPEALAHFARLLEAAGDLESAGRIHLQQLGTFAVAPRRAAAEFARKCVLEGKRPLAIAVARQVARSGDVPVTICSDLARTAPADSPDPGLGALLDAALAHLPISVTTSERTGLVVALARQLRLAGRPAEASRRLKEAIELNPADPPAQQELADLLRQGGELARMQTAFERIAGRAPDSMHAWLHLAEARIALRRGLPAQEAAARAVALDAGSFEAHLTFARACRLTQDYARAIAAYRQALRLRPNDPRTLCELAACYGASGLHELAGGHWRRVLEHAPRGSRLARAAWRFLGKAEVES
ncbi:MAG: tetratricopeptide repeat protein, partial [Candidatus Wallbacteria bacterium]|nr:tetratricopeptide repeat protein [Candidatus Wallbacteria bacterium]